jgi:hypothetical protein
MIDLLLQVGFIFLVLAVISLFVCTLPVWLVVLVVVLLLRWSGLLGWSNDAGRVDEEFQKLSEKEQIAQRDRELDSITEEDWDRFYFNCTGRHLGDPIPPEELVDADDPERFQ